MTKLIVLAAIALTVAGGMVLLNAIAGAGSTGPLTTIELRDRRDREDVGAASAPGASAQVPATAAGDDGSDHADAD